MMIENIQQMKKKIRQSGFVFLLMVVLFSCYEPYLPPDVSNSASYLVVDAFINATDGSATVKLSHTIPLASTDTLDQINDATVALHDASGHASMLKFQSNGFYTGKDLDIASDGKYQLVITRGEKTYQSDLVNVQITPSIDTLGWSTDGNYLNINVSTHDQTGASRFYRWKYTETWEYNSSYPTPYIVKHDSVWVRTKDENIARCWQTLPYAKIIIYSTDYLSGDMVSNFTVQKIPSNSIKLSNKYSIHVQQQTLSKAAYTYWQNVKKTTESLGGLYDPLPGAVSGNIHSVSDPDERVIGFFSIGSVSEKRIFIKNSELRSFLKYEYPSCLTDTIISEKPWYENKPRLHFGNPDQVIAQITSSDGSTIMGYVVSPTLCTDCRVRGGNTVRPNFWKD
jgi:hypothetical protein